MKRKYTWIDLIRDMVTGLFGVAIIIAIIRWGM